MKDIAHEVGITERAVHQIIKELKEADYISSERNGRKNSYKVKLNRPLRHAIEKHKKVSDLVSLINVDL